MRSANHTDRTVLALTESPVLVCHANRLEELVRAHLAQILEIISNIRYGIAGLIMRPKIVIATPVLFVQLSIRFAL